MTAPRVAHTPGPWEMDPATLMHYAVVGGRSGAIAQLHRNGRPATQEVVEQINADARLIAAAPDLFRALVDLVRETDGGTQPCGHQFHQQAADAIRKAEAGQ